MLLLPPFDEQRRVTEVLDQAEALCAKRRQALVHLDDLTQSIFLDMFGVALKAQERVPLRAMTEVITKGTTPTSVGLKFTNFGVPFIRVQNLIGGTLRFGANDLFIDGAANRDLARSRVRSGDLLISIAGTIGRCAIVPDGSPEMNCNQAVAVVRLSDPSLGPWLMAWLSSPDAVQQTRAASVTATISNLSLGQLGSLQVPRVNRDRIDLFLARLRAAKAAYDPLSAGSSKLEVLLKSLQDQAFGGRL